MILVYHYAIWPPTPKTIFIKHFCVKIMALSFVFFHRDCFPISDAFSVRVSVCLVMTQGMIVAHSCVACTASGARKIGFNVTHTKAFCFESTHRKP